MLNRDMKFNNTGRLFVVWITISVLIIANSLYFAHGCLSTDSTYYLQQALNLTKGNGFLIPDLFSQSGHKNIVTWPVGYPVAIFIVAKCLAVNVFIASKLLNIILLGLSFILLNCWFKSNAWIISLVYLIDTLLTIVFYSWSENLFIFLLLCYTYSFVKYFQFPSLNRYPVYLFLTTTSLFLTRYIGIIFIVPIFVLSVYFYLKHLKSQFRILLLVCLLTCGIVILYFFTYLAPNGFIPVSFWDHNHQTFVEYSQELFIGFFQEILPVGLVFRSRDIMSGDKVMYAIVLITFLIFSFFIFRIFRKSTYSGLKANFLIPLLIGLLYYITIAVYKIFYTIDEFDSRLLGPGTFLILISLGVYLLGSSKFKAIFIKKSFISIILFVLIYYSPPVLMYFYSESKEFITLIKENCSYPEYKKEVFDYYKGMPENSVVMFANKYTNYLLPNIQRIEPKVFKNRSLEDIDHLIIRLRATSQIKHAYIEIRPNLKPNRYHPSIYQFMEEHKGEKFYRIK